MMNKIGRFGFTKIFLRNSFVTNNKYNTIPRRLFASTRGVLCEKIENKSNGIEFEEIKIEGGSEGLDDVFKKDNRRRREQGEGSGRKRRNNNKQQIVDNLLKIGVISLFAFVLLGYKRRKDREEKKDSVNVLDQFIAPTYVMENRELFPSTRKIKIGGIVKDGSIKHNKNSFLTTFVLTDLKTEMVVEHKGSLPDLFTEGTGAIIEGFMIDTNRFKCVQVAAKHDARYMPQELALIVSKNKRMMEEKKLKQDKIKYLEMYKKEQEEQEKKRNLQPSS